MGITKDLANALLLENKKKLTEDDADFFVKVINNLDRTIDLVKKSEPTMRSAIGVNTNKQIITNLLTKEMKELLQDPNYGYLKDAISTFISSEKKLRGQHDAFIESLDNLKSAMYKFVNKHR